MKKKTKKRVVHRDCIGCGEEGVYVRCDRVHGHHQTINSPRPIIQGIWRRRRRRWSRSCRYNHHRGIHIRRVCSSYSTICVEDRLQTRTDRHPSGEPREMLEKTHLGHSRRRTTNILLLFFFLFQRTEKLKRKK